EDRVVLGNRGAEEERLPAAKLQLEPGQKAGAGVVQPVRARRSGNEIAVRIEHRETPVLLQDTESRGRPLGLTENGELSFELQDCSHHATPVRTAPGDRREITVS